MKKVINYYIGIIWEENTKRDNKKSKVDGRSEKFRRGCENVLCFLPVFWFCGSEFQLISSCSSYIPIFNINSL